MVDCVLVEVHRLNVVLIIEPVVQCVMSLVIRVEDITVMVGGGFMMLLLSEVEMWLVGLRVLKLIVVNGLVM